MTSSKSSNLGMRMDPIFGRFKISPAMGNFHMVIGKSRWYGILYKRHSILLRTSRKIKMFNLLSIQEKMSSSTNPIIGGKVTSPIILRSSSLFTISFLTIFRYMPQSTSIESMRHKISRKPSILFKKWLNPLAGC